MDRSEQAKAWTACEASEGVGCPFPIPRVNVMGVGIHAVNLNSALTAAFWAARQPSVCGYITATGVHGVIESQYDSDLQVVHNQSLLSLPDGAPMAWVGKFRGHATMSQVAGPDFMRSVFARSAGSVDRHYLWGGADGVVSLLKGKIETSNPGVAIVGIETPPFRPLAYDEELKLVDRINRARANFFWVGLSTPKQERFMAGFLERHRDLLQLDKQGFVMLGVGAAFDFLAGTQKEAPRWLRGSGFEWLFRVVKEPRRLWRRYLWNNCRFMLGSLQQALRPSQFPMNGYDRIDPLDR